MTTAFVHRGLYPNGGNLALSANQMATLALQNRMRTGGLAGPQSFFSFHMEGEGETGIETPVARKQRMFLDELRADLSSSDHRVRAGALTKMNSLHDKSQAPRGLLHLLAEHLKLEHDTDLQRQMLTLMASLPGKPDELSFAINALLEFRVSETVSKQKELRENANFATQQLAERLLWVSAKCQLSDCLEFPAFRFDPVNLSVTIRRAFRDDAYLPLAQVLLKLVAKTGDASHIVELDKLMSEWDKMLRGGGSFSDITPVFLSTGDLALLDRDRNLRRTDDAPLPDKMALGLLMKFAYDAIGALKAYEHAKARGFTQPGSGIEV